MKLLRPTKRHSSRICTARVGASVSVATIMCHCQGVPRSTSFPYLTSPRETLQYGLFYGAFDVTYHIPSQTEWQTYIRLWKHYPPATSLFRNSSLLASKSFIPFSVHMRKKRTILWKCAITHKAYDSWRNSPNTREFHKIHTFSILWISLCFCIQNCTENWMIYEYLSWRIVCFFCHFANE